MESAGDMEVGKERRHVGAAEAIPLAVAAAWLAAIALFGPLGLEGATRTIAGISWFASLSIVPLVAIYLARKLYKRRRAETFAALVVALGVIAYGIWIFVRME